MTALNGLLKFIGSGINMIILLSAIGGVILGGAIGQYLAYVIANKLGWFDYD